MGRVFRFKDKKIGCVVDRRGCFLGLLVAMRGFGVQGSARPSGQPAVEHLVSSPQVQVRSCALETHQI